jgi:hypothetical protein
VRLFLLLGFTILRFTCRASDFRLEGEPYLPPTNAAIVWAVSVTNLPTDLWVYKVLPQSFAPSVISNIMAMGRFDIKNLVGSSKQQLEYDAHFKRFVVTNKKGTMLRQLEIAPSRGWITFEGSVGDEKDALEVAPTVDEVIRLGLKCVYEVGIDSSLIEPKPRSMSVSTTERGNSQSVTTDRGVFFSRKIDGIDERGFAFTCNFGTHNGKPQLLGFDLNWRNLVPYEPCSITDTNQITNLIKSGRATFMPQAADLDDLINAGKLTITRFSPIYFSRPQMDKIEFEYPYAEMTVVADLGSTNTTTFFLNCPIIDDGKP